MKTEKYQISLIEYLSEFVTEKRLEKFNEIISSRTRHITIGLEDIFQPHNASAVLRSCECLGIQDIHIIENNNKYEVNPDVALGSSKWLTLCKYNKEKNNSLACINNLKAQGYKIFATSSHKHNYSIDQIDINDKIALFFGTEMHGISQDIAENADGLVNIPMYGFTESFNISVSAAICIYSLTSRLRKSTIDWQLSDNEKLEIKLQWLKNTIKDAKALEVEFKKKFSL